MSRRVVRQFQRDLLGELGRIDLLDVRRLEGLETRTVRHFHQPLRRVDLPRCARSRELLQFAHQRRRFFRITEIKQHLQ